MTKTEQKTFSTLGLYLSSFFQMNEILPRLEINNGRVTFNFPVSDNLYKLMMNYNSNLKVPVTDFVTTVKTLRGQR